MKNKLNKRKMILLIICLLFIVLFIFQNPLISVKASALEDSKASDVCVLPGNVKDNTGKNNYSIRTSPMTSFLVENKDGSLTKLQACGDSVIIEDYNIDTLELLSTKEIEYELPLFGGFFNGDDFYFLVFGQTNGEENNDKEVLRVVKYDKSWNRLDSCSVNGANTTVPFNAGSLRMDEVGSKLYIHTAHKMYRSSDGLNHQANMTFVIDKQEMTVIDSWYSVMNVFCGYVSHSFNQFVKIDGDKVYRLDHGDAYPRAINLSSCSVYGSITNVDYCHPFSFKGISGDNYTGASLGGFEITANNCVIALNTIDQDYNANTTNRNIMIISVNKDFNTVEKKMLTDYSQDVDIDTSTPQLVKIDGNQLVVLWEEYGAKSWNYITTKAVCIDEMGNMTTDVVSLDMRLSDCQPILCKDGIIRWFNSTDKECNINLINPSLLTSYKNPHANDFNFTIENNEASVISVNKYLEGDVVIPDKYEDCPVTRIKEFAFQDCKKITSITIPNTVTLIEKSAFEGCTGLVNLTIPDSVKSIEDGAFYVCTGLTNITVTEGNTVYDSRENCNAIIETATNTLVVGCKNTVIPNSVTSIGDGAFYCCTGIEKINIPDSITLIESGAFEDCTGLTSITISDSIISIEKGAFYNTAYYNDEKNWDNGVLYIDECLIDASFFIESVNIKVGTKLIADKAFYWCEKLTSIIIPDSVTLIGSGAFEDCTGLVNLTIPDSVTSIGYDAFYNTGYYNNDANWDNGILYINNHLIKADNKKVSGEIEIKSGIKTIADNAFKWFTDVTRITIPDSVTTIGKYAFDGCEISTLEISASVTKIDETAFYRLNTIIVNEDNTVYDSRENCNAIIETATNTLIKASDNTTVIPDTVTTIDKNAFRGCSIYCITIPASVKEINSDVFSSCSNLQKIIFFGKDTVINRVNDNIPWHVDILCYKDSKAMEYAQKYKFNYFELIDGSSEECFTYEVYNDSAIITDVNEGVIGNVVVPKELGGYPVTEIVSSAFLNCSLMTAVELPDTITLIESGVFEGCTGLASITVAEGNMTYDSRENCNAIIEVETNTLIAGCNNTVIPNSVTAIGSYAFYNCNKIKIISLPEGLTSIGDYAFRDCTGLVNLTIPDSVTSIEDYSFEGCAGLINLTIPDSVTSIGDYAFRDCTGLVNLTIPDSVISIGNCSFEGCTELINLTIPDSLTSIGYNALYNTGYYNNEANWDNGVLYIEKNLLNADYFVESVNIKVGTKLIADKAFYGREKFTSINIPDSVTSIGRSAFENCTGLVDLTIPDSVTLIGRSAFENCTGLVDLTIPDSVTLIGYNAFYNTGYYNNEANWDNGILYINNHLITANEIVSSAVEIRSGTKTIADYAFAWNYELTGITIPESVTLISKFAFYDCKNLETIIVDAKNKVYDSRENCNAIIETATNNLIKATNNTSVIPNSVVSIDKNAFRNCDNISIITIPESVKEINSDIFSPCYNLQQIVFFGKDTVIKKGENNFSSLISILCYKDSKAMDYAQKYEFNYSDLMYGSSVECFSYEVYNDSVAITDVKEGAMGKVIIPKELDGYPVTEIDAFAFSNCRLMTDVELPNTILTIDDFAFAVCTGLEEINIPDSVTLIDEYAFYDCTGLARIIINNPNVYIVDIGCIVPETTSIHGYNNSTAQSYAEEYNREFVSLGDYVPPHVHTIVDVEAKIATCTEDGYNAYKKCTECDYTEGYKAITASGHILENIEAKASTCTEDGYNAYKKCTECDYAEGYKVITASGHILENIEAKSATCAEDGYYAYKKCTQCDYTEGYEVISAAHSLESIEAKAATCTEDGYYAYKKCTQCDYTEGYEVISAAHSLEGIEAKAATCTEDGYYAYKKCTQCDYTEGYEVISAAHSLESIEAKAATCTEDGYYAYKKCTQCDYTEGYEVISAAHSLESIEAKAATCTEDGYYAYKKCTVCDYTEGYEVINATHAQGEWEVKIPATTQSAGEEIIRCTECGQEIESRIIPILEELTTIPEETTTRPEETTTKPEESTTKPEETTTKPEETTTKPEETTTITEETTTIPEESTTITSEDSSQQTAIKIEVKESKNVKLKGDKEVYILPEQKVFNIISAFNEGVVIKDVEGNIISSKTPVGSGFTVNLLDKDGNIIDCKTIIVPGDNDSDGKGTANDARKALRKSVNIESFNSWQTLASKLTIGEKITAADARIILRLSVKLEKAEDILNNALNPKAHNPTNPVQDRHEAENSKQLTAVEIYDKAITYTVEVNVIGRKFSSIGSGFFISSDGKIVTNYHVIEDATEITVKDYNGNEYQVKRILAYDANMDLAVLKVDTTNAAYAQINKSIPRTGSTVYTLGSSQGLTGTFTNGIVSNGERTVDEYNPNMTYIQVTAPITNGNSGGPLIDEYAQVIGINTWGLTDGQNLNFAIPTKYIDNLDYSNSVIIEDFKSTNSASTGKLEVNITECKLLMGGTAVIQIEYTNDIYGGDLIVERDPSLLRTEWEVNDYYNSSTGNNIAILYVSAIESYVNTSIKIFVDGYKDSIYVDIPVTISSNGWATYGGLSGAPDYGAYLGVSPIAYTTSESGNFVAFGYDINEIIYAGNTVQYMLDDFFNYLLSNGFESITSLSENTFAFYNENLDMEYQCEVAYDDYGEMMAILIYVFL